MKFGTKLKHQNCGEICRLIGGFCIVAVCASDTESFVTYWNDVYVRMLENACGPFKAYWSRDTPTV